MSGERIIGLQGGLIAFVAPVLVFVVVFVLALAGVVLAFILNLGALIIRVGPLIAGEPVVAFTFVVVFVFVFVSLISRFVFTTLGELVVTLLSEFQGHDRFILGFVVKTSKTTTSRGRNRDSS